MSGCLCLTYFPELSERERKIGVSPAEGAIGLYKTVNQTSKRKKISSPLRSSRDDNTGEDRAKNLVPDSQLVYTDTAP